MKKSNLYVVAVILFVVLGSASLVSAKGHGGSSLRDPYVWEPKTSKEKIIEHVRIGADDKLWKHSIYQIGVELEKMKEVPLPPEVLEKLSAYSQHVLDRLFKSQDVDDARKISEALTLFKEKGVKNFPDIQKALHHQYAVIGKKMLDTLRERCRNQADVKNILRDIDAVLVAGVSLQEIEVSSVEEMRDLALCR
ncbi:MAG TPA: hypothetical protein DDY52_00680 [Candidatus Moranbacteria bacterium]|nr:hypothetical protein [Candidatus Moranbacteria bacterium]